MGRRAGELVMSQSWDRKEGSKRSIGPFREMVKLG